MTCISYNSLKGDTRLRFICKLCAKTASSYIFITISSYSSKTRLSCCCYCIKMYRILAGFKSLKINSNMSDFIFWQRIFIFKDICPHYIFLEIQFASQDNTCVNENFKLPYNPNLVPFSLFEDKPIAGSLKSDYKPRIVIN